MKKIKINEYLKLSKEIKKYDRLSKITLFFLMILMSTILLTQKNVKSEYIELCGQPDETIYNRFRVVINNVSYDCRDYGIRWNDSKLYGKLCNLSKKVICRNISKDLYEKRIKELGG